MKKSRFEEELVHLRNCAFDKVRTEINGIVYDTVFKWANLVPNCTRSEMRRRLWYREGRKKVRIPTGIAFDGCREGVLYPRDGGIVLPQGWDTAAQYSHYPHPIICGRFKYGKKHPQKVAIVPPLNLDGSTFMYGDRTEHLKAILNGLAQMCRATLENKAVFKNQDLVDLLAEAIHQDGDWRRRLDEEETKQVMLRARIILTNYLTWYEGWTAAGQPIEPEVEEE